MDTDEPGGKSQPVVLSYRPRGSAGYARGSPPHVRAVAAAMGILLLLLVTYLLIASARPREELLPFIPSIIVALAGAAFCALIAAGMIGKHRRDPD